MNSPKMRYANVGIDGDDRTGQVEAGQQCSCRWDLVALGRDGELSKDGAADVVQGGDQVWGSAIAAACSAHRLVVDRDHPPTSPYTGAVHTHAPMTRARASASTRANTRRNVDSSGARTVPPPAAIVSACPAAHSPIAANEREPATTALNPIASSCAIGYRTPRRARGAGTAPNSVTRSGTSGTA